MRTIFALCAAVLVGAGFLLHRATRLPDSYGAFTGAPEVPVADLIARPRDYLRRTVAASGTVRKQCTAMGCFFFFYHGEAALRVDLQEIAMNAPRKNGRRARVEGQLVPYGDAYQLYASAVEFE